MSEQQYTHSDQGVILRISGEYLEMPGLRLTAEQAQRLFGLGEPACTAALEALVTQGFLARHGDGRYIRVADGPGLPPFFRQAAPGMRQTA